LTLFVVESYNGICRYELFEKQRHILLTSLLSVVIPLLIMGVLYGLMAIEARKQVLYTRIIPVNVNFVRPGNTRTEMNAGRVACYPSPSKSR